MLGSGVAVSLGAMSCITERGIIDSLSLAVESQDQPHRQAFVFCVLSRSLKCRARSGYLNVFVLAGKIGQGRHRSACTTHR